VTARRAGWIGCNIALNRIPPDARIPIVTTSASPCLSGSNSCSFVQFVSPPEQVRAQFRKIKPLQEIPITQRGWMLDILNIVHRIAETKRRKPGALQDASRIMNAPDERASVLDCGGPPPLSHGHAEPIHFTNQDVYAFAHELEQLHPDNRHIRDKIRQQLQNLARAGLLTHAARNDYRV
jgi:type II restriction enzyme